jgi:hypothetical protein
MIARSFKKHLSSPILGHLLEAHSLLPYLSAELDCRASAELCLSHHSIDITSKMNNLAQMSGEPKRTFRDTTQRGVAGKGQIPTMVNQTGLEEDSDDSDKPAKRSGRRKIKIEYIEDKNRRHITFSKRKAGIMKKVNISISI